MNMCRNLISSNEEIKESNKNLNEKVDSIKSDLTVIKQKLNNTCTLQQNAIQNM